MEIVKYKMPSRDFNLYFIGDTHIGNIQSYEEGIEEAVDNILSDEHGYAVFMGDAVDAITPNDPRYTPMDNMNATYNVVDKEIDRFVEIFSPLAASGRLIGVLTGNHELSFLKHNNVDITGMICKLLKVENLGWTAVLMFEHKRTLLRLLVTHGSTSATTDAGVMNAIKREGKKWLNIDLVVSGHTHRLGPVFPDVSLKITPRGEVVNVYKEYAYSGAFLRNYVEHKKGYGEILSYNPLPLGYLKVCVEDMRIASIEPIYVGR